MTSSLRKVVRMFRIKFPTKHIFRIFPILRTDGMVPWGTYLWNDPRTYNQAKSDIKIQKCINYPLQQFPNPKHLLHGLVLLGLTPKQFNDTLTTYKCWKAVNYMHRSLLKININNRDEQTLSQLAKVTDE